MHTGRSNGLVREAIEAGRVAELAGYAVIRPEVKYGAGSRIDFLLQGPGRADCYVEVKNVTAAVEGGVGWFPDAVTTRGAKHLREMAAMVAAYILKSALYYVITVVGHKMGVLVESDMRRDIFTHMQALSCSFYDKNRTGVLMSRITGDLFEVTELAHHGPENILICTLTIVGALGIMYTLEWRLALVLTVIIPVCLWFTLSQRVRMKNLPPACITVGAVQRERIHFAQARGLPPP